MQVEELLKKHPFSEKIPDNINARNQTFIRELAIGSLANYWISAFNVNTRTGQPIWSISVTESSSLVINKDLLTDYLRLKWNTQIPDVKLLVQQGYLSENKTKGLPSYELTPSAFELVNQPVPISVFISYRNEASSVFALLLSARMQLVGLKPFLDITGLQGGDDWDKMLQTRLAESETCICLIGKTSLNSSYVQKEIRVALKKKLRIIPVFHNGFTDADLHGLATQKDEVGELAKLLVKSQGITVRAEKAREYNSAVIDILNALGVTP